MKELKYFTYIINTTDKEHLINQNTSIKNYKKNNNITISKNYIYEEDFNRIKIGKYIFEVLEKLSFGDTLIVANFNILGDTVSKIIKTINFAKFNNITLHLIDENLTLHIQNKPLFYIISMLLSVDDRNKKNKIDLAEATFEKNNSTPGRKSGKKTKSIFDEYKKDIVKLDKMGVPIHKILYSIKQKDNDIYKDNYDQSKIKNSKVQSLGKYITKIKKYEKDRIEKKNINKKTTSIKKDQKRDSYTGSEPKTMSVDGKFDKLMDGF